MAKTKTPESLAIHALSPDRLPITSPLRSTIFDIGRMGQQGFSHEVGE